MKFLRNFLDAQHKHFVKGGKLEKYYPLYEMLDTFLYTPPDVNTGEVHVRDGIDLKRTMITVALALTPIMFWTMYNTGLQSQLALESMGKSEILGWRGSVFEALGFAIDSSSILTSFVIGALYFLPIFLVTNLVGGFWEALFATIRKHEINEGFLVTGMLFPLILPATIPLWQVALGISFGVVVGKEIFGGTGKNFLNPALTARVFLFFAYPAQITGDAVWVAADGYTGATALGIISQSGVESLKLSWLDAFIGFMPGSVGETSALLCLFGALVLVLTGIGSWRIMLSMTVAAILTALMFNAIGSETNHMFAVTPAWHLVLGGFAFGCVFMATDPVSASMTQIGQYFYGILIGFMVVLIRVINPAYPEGVMLAILFGNVFAPTIDYFVINTNIKRRKLKYES